MQGAYLDDTTTDIEKYLKSKQPDKGKAPTPGPPEQEPRMKLNIGMISSFLKKQEE